MASQQLEVVSRLARERQDTEAQALGRAQAQLATVQAQMNQVLAYQADYRAMARGEATGSMAASQLVEARRFLDEVNAIVARQEAQLREAEMAVNRQQIAWTEATRYAQAIEKLRLQRRTEQAQAEDKRLQQQLDDLYGQSGFRAP